MSALLRCALNRIVAAAAQAVLAKLAPVPAPGAALALGMGNGCREFVSCRNGDRRAHERLGKVDARALKLLERLGRHGERRASGLRGLLGNDAIGGRLLIGLGEGTSRLDEGLVGPEQGLVLGGSHRRLVPVGEAQRAPGCLA